MAAELAQHSTAQRARRVRRTNADDIELETALQELALNLRRDAVETDMAVGVDGGGRNGRHLA